MPVEPPADSPRPKSRRTQQAAKRLAELAARHEATGVSKEDAHERALEEMRANSRGDWRNG